MSTSAPNARRIALRCALHKTTLSSRPLSHTASIWNLAEHLLSGTVDARHQRTCKVL